MPDACRARESTSTTGAPIRVTVLITSRATSVVRSTVHAPPNAGLDVLTTVNIQHVDGVKDLIERITGITVRETIPDWLLDEADDLQFIDITQEALRKRMRHGNIHPSQRIDPALRNFFSETNLTALREIGRRLGLDGPAERRGAGGRGRAGPAARRRSGRAA